MDPERTRAGSLVPCNVRVLFLDVERSLHYNGTIFSLSAVSHVGEMMSEGQSSLWAWKLLIDQLYYNCP